MMRNVTAELRAAQATITELRVQLARQTAHFDWLSAHVNELKLERAAMLERCLGIQLAGVPQIERSPVLPGVDPSYLPTEFTKPPIGDVIAKARDIVGDARRPGAEGRDTIAAADLQSISFEDMGDELARTQGITHTRDGGVAYSER